MSRTPVALRVIRKAHYIVRQYERGERVKPLMLDWARAVVRFNPQAEVKK